MYSIILAARCTAKKANGCCTSKTPCVAGEGDCDSDSQCAKGLKCGKDNCGKGFPKWADCCV